MKKVEREREGERKRNPRCVKCKAWFPSNATHAIDAADPTAKTCNTQAVVASVTYLALLGNHAQQAHARLMMKLSRSDVRLLLLQPGGVQEPRVDRHPHHHAMQTARRHSSIPQSVDVSGCRTFASWTYFPRTSPLEVSPLSRVCDSQTSLLTYT